MDIPVDQTVDSGVDIVLEEGQKVGCILGVGIHLEDHSFEVRVLRIAEEEEGDLHIAVGHIVEMAGLHIAVDRIVVGEQDYRIVGAEAEVPAANRVEIDRKEADYFHHSSKTEVVHIDSFPVVRRLHSQDDQYG